MRVTHRSSVTEDQIDDLGHMNVRYYAVNARAGTAALLDEFQAGGFRHSTVDVYTRHHREQLLGTPLELRSAYLSVESRCVRIHHELRAADTDTLAATFVHSVVAVDPSGATVDLPDELVHVASDEAIELPDYAVPRTISIDADPLRRPPRLREVRELDLAVRHERSVPTEECDADGAYRPELAPLLVWGGHPVEGETQLPLPFETEGGELMAWASMETRIANVRWPRLGDRIQSFGAPIQVLDKVTHRMHWCFDVDAGDLLASFEVVSMAFDIRARRPMSIPQTLREREQQKLRPDLAPAGAI